jgi:hypothetical protein
VVRSISPVKKVSPRLEAQNERCWAPYAIEHWADYRAFQNGALLKFKEGQSLRGLRRRLFFSA